MIKLINYQVFYKTQLFSAIKSVKRFFLRKRLLIVLGEIGVVDWSKSRKDEAGSFRQEQQISVPVER